MSLRRFHCLIILLFVSTSWLSVFAQQTKGGEYIPNVQTAISIGKPVLWPLKGGCTATSCSTPIPITLTTVGTQVCGSGCNNVNQTAGPDFPANNCYDLPNPTVWFSVVPPTGTATLQINVTSPNVTNPTFAVYSSANCLNYTIYDDNGECYQGAGGSVAGNMFVPNDGTVILIGVSAPAGQVGDFNICITPQPDNSACNVDNVLSVTGTSMGSPAAGPYQVGETVSFCYTINTYEQDNCNWLQGIVPTFGNCWDPSSFTVQGEPISVTTPLQVEGSFYASTGAWDWWPSGSVTYNTSGANVGAGWFFSQTAGTDPDNSWGDGNGMGVMGSCEGATSGLSWTVCFDLTVTANCATNPDCSISIKTYADGEIGSWTSLGCAADLPAVSSATVVCCLLTVNAGTDQTICSNGSIGLNGSFANNDGATSVVWTSSPAGAVAGLSNPNSLTPTFTPPVGITGPVTFTLSVTDESCTIQDQVTVNVNPNPTVNDPADVLVCPSATIDPQDFVSIPAGATFNWTNSNTAIGLAASGSGQITPYSAPANVTGSLVSGNITVTPTLNGCSGPSQVFTIGINSSPTVNDPADQVLCANQSTTAVTFSGNSGSTTYNWTNSNTSIGLAASGSGNIASFTAINAGATAQVANIVVTPVLGTCSGTPQTFSITVNPVPTVNDPADQVMCAGVATTAVNFSGNSGSTTYNWTNDNTSIGLAASGSGNIASFTSVNAGITTQVATIVVTPVLGTCTGTPQTFTITVNPVPTVNDPADQVLCANQSTTAVTFSGNSGSTTYNWTNSNTSIGLAASGSGNIASFTGLNAGATAQVANIVVTPVLGSCTGTTQSFTITVNPVPTVNDPADQLLCANTSTTSVNFTGNSGSTVYNWTNDNATIGLGASGSGNIASFTALNSGSTPQIANIVVTPVLGTCTGSTQTFTITVNPIPTVVDPADQALCANQSTTAVNFTGNSGLTTYNWTNTNTSIGLAASGSGNIASFTAINAGATVQNASITVTPVLNSCSGTPQTFTITVNPVPTVNDPLDQTLCAGTSTSAVNFSGNSLSTVYNWTNDNASIGLAASGSGNIASFTALNAGSSPEVANIIVTPVLGTCTGATQAFVITVNPIPSFTTSFTDPLSCGASDGTITLSGLLPSTNYDLSYTDDGTPVGPLNITTTVTGTYVITGLDAGGYSNIIINNGSCNSASASVSLSDPSSPIFTISLISNPTTCGGVDGGIHIEGTGTLTPMTAYDLTYVDNGSAVGPISIMTDANGDYDITGLNAGTYTSVTLDLAGCVGSQPGPITLTDPVPPVASASTTTPAICEGSDIILNGNNVPGSTYSWTGPDSYSSTFEDNIIVAATTLASGVYTYTITLNNCTSAPSTVNVTVDPLPVISGTLAACVGQTSQLNATTSPGVTPWTSSDPSIATVSATGLVTAVANGSVTITYTNSGGCQDAETFVVSTTPTVNDPFDQTLCASTSVSAVVFTGNNAMTTYNWVNDNTSIGLAANGTGDIPSFVATNAGITAITATITVTPELGTCSGTPQSFTITVNPVPTVNDPLDQALCAGASTSAVTFSGNSGSTVYDWTNDNATTGLSASGSGNIASFTSMNAGAVPNVSNITVIPTLGSCSGSSQIFSITVNPVPTVVDPTDQTLCAGGSTSTITFTGNSGSTAYDWVNDNPSIGLAANGSGDISSFTSVNAGSTVQIANISVVPTLGTCTGVSQIFSITVNPVPTVNDPADQSLCAGSSTAAVTFTGNSGSTSYDWVNDNTSTGLAVSGSGNISSFNGTNAGSTSITSTITVTPTLGSCTGTPQTFTITINPIPTVNDPLDQDLCAGSSTTAVVFSGNSGSTTYNWSNDNNTIGLGSNGSGDISSFTSVNGGTVSEIANITVTPVLGSCTGSGQLFSITVNPIPTVLDPADQVICAGESTTTVNFSGNIAGSSYDWTNDNVSIGLGATGSTAVVSFVGQNSGTTAQTANITVTPTAGICSGTSQIFTITVNPNPTFSVSGNDPSVCNGSDGDILVYGLVPGVSYDVTYDDDGAGMNISQAANGAGEILISGLNAGVYDNFNVAITASGCNDQSTSVVVLNNPGAPILDPLGDQIQCDGFILPDITGSGLTGNESYWTGTGGTGTQLAEGSTVSTSQTIYIYDINGSCFDEESFDLTINLTPSITTPADQVACGSYDLPVINGTNLSSSVAYYNDSQANTGTVITGPITSTQTVWIYDANGSCSDETSFLVTINNPPTVTSVTGQGTYCAGDVVAPIMVDVTGTANWTIDYTLNGTPLQATGSTSPISLGNSAGIYVVTGVTDNSCSNSASGTQTIVVNSIPAAPTAGSDTTYCSAWTLVPMTAQGTGGTYTWYDVNGAVISTGSTLTPNNSVGVTEYYVSETVSGCEGPSSVVTITIIQCEITVPTAFTPDGDGVNDSWEIVDLDAVYPDNVVTVFNRWGNIVFQHDSSVDGAYDANRWDGTFKGEDLPVASYYFVIDLNDEEKNTKTGTISILKK